MSRNLEVHVTWMCARFSGLDANEVTINTKLFRVPELPREMGRFLVATRAMRKIVTLFASRLLDLAHISATCALRGSDSFSRFDFLERLGLA